MVVLCFQKHNVQYKKISFAEIACYKIDFLRHKFSDIKSMSTLEQLALIYLIQWLYCWVKDENERSRKDWLFMYFTSMSSIRNKSFICVTPFEYVKLFWYLYGMLMAVYGSHIWYYFSVCFHRINFYHIYCDENKKST